MRSASRLYRLGLLLGATGVGVVGLATVAAVQGLRLEPGLLGELAAACTGMLPALGAAGYVELGFTVLAGASFALGARSLRRQLRTTREYLRGLGPALETVRVGGVSCRVTGGRAPRALCAGYLAPRVYVSRGALEALTSGELQAVVAHELHHVRRRDPLRLLVARVLADALFFLPVLRRIGERYAALIELAADEAAVRELGQRRTLAAALLKFGHLEAPGAAVAGIAPERVDHLGGDSDAARWRISRAELAASALAGLALLAGVAVLLAVPGAAAVDVTRVVAQSCMLLIAAGLLAAAVAGRGLRGAGASRG